MSIGQQAMSATLERVNSWPFWARILLLYGVSRVVSSVLLATVFLMSTAAGWSFASFRDDASFFTFSGSWDASAYKSIGEHGYPFELPRDSSGDVTASAWAFLPLYPLVVQAGVALTAGTFYTVGTIVSVAFGAGAAYFLGALLRPRIGEARALWASALFLFGPTAFLLQVAYAESMFLCSLFFSLWAIDRGCFAAAAVGGVLAAFIRPGALALALTIGLIVITSFMGTRHPMTWRQRIRASIAALVIAAAGLGWPVIAGIVTGEPDAYLQSELAYWRPLVGETGFVPLTPWFLLAQRYLPVIGPLIVIAIVAAAVLWFRRERVRELGQASHLFSISYALYLFAVFLPQQSILRLMMPLAPMLGDRAFRSATRRRTAIILATCVVMQAVMIVGLWFLAFP